MLVRSVADAVALVRQEIGVEIAGTPEQVQDAYRLRHQVYCVEHGYEDGAAGLETDAFDANARHALLRHLQSGEIVGTVRVVLPKPDAPNDSFPMQHLVDPALLDDVPLGSTAEVSRFAISKHRRDISRSSVALMRVGLMRGITQISWQAGMTHWFAVMEPTLHRLLQTTGVHFHGVGPLVEHHGLRQPSYANIGVLLDRMAEEQPTIWNYITNAGAWCPWASHRLIAA
jgi:N-acyl-L-homoserine lactone synthetase